MSKWSRSPNLLEADCFGGAFDMGDDTGYGKTYSYTKDSSCCAYMLVYERKVRSPLKLLAPLLEGDSTTSPRTFDLRPYDQLLKSIPTSVLQSVLRDNDKFNFERHIYSPEFFKFFSEILQASVSMSDINLTKLGTQFTLDIMAHAFDNRLLPDVTQTLKQLYAKYEFECVDLFETIIADNMRTVLDLLLVCSEKTTRACISDLLAHVLNILIRLDGSEHSLAKRFMSGLLDLIPKEAHKHWVRFQQFWDLFRDFSAGGPEQAQFLVEKGAIGILIDFYLGSKSPLLKPGEKRETLGSKMWGPVYDGLIQTVGILSDYCSPDPDNLTGPGIWLDEDSQKCIVDKEFIDKTLRGGFDGKSLGKVVAKWGKGNYEYSLKVAHLLLKVLNDIEYEEVKGIYDVLDAYITIQDSYQRLRIEWIMGFPVPQKVTREDVRLPYYGSSTISAIDDEVWSYQTPLCFGHNYYDTTESILSLIWRHRRRWDQYCVGCIQNLFSICLKSRELSIYMERLPAPTYQYARYVDWIEEYLMTFKESQAAWSSNYVIKKEDTLGDALLVYQQFKVNSIQLHPYPFIMGRTLSCQLYDSLDTGEIQVLIYEYTLEYMESKPNGRTNDALPRLKTRADMPVKSFTSYRPTQLSLDQSKSHTNYPTNTGHQREEGMEEEADNKNIPMKTFVTNEERPEVTGFEPVPEPEMEHQAALILRFVVKNHGLEGHRIVLGLKGEGAKNYLCPESDFTIELAGKTERDLVTLVKLDAHFDWGEVSPVLRLESPQTFGQTDEYKETVLPYINVDDLNVRISDAGSADDDGKAPAGMVSCPQCTFYNPASALKCDVCDSPLKSLS